MHSTLGIRQDIAGALLLVLVLGKAGVVCWLLLTLLRMVGELLYSYLRYNFKNNSKKSSRSGVK